MEFGNFNRGGGGGGFRDRNDRGGNFGGGNRGGGGGFRDRNDRGGNFGGGNRGGGGGFRDRNDDFGGGRERDNEESVFSKRVRAGRRRTYFFDVRKTRGEDFFITITESTRRDDGFGYKRHKIFLYKEDFNRFAQSLQEVVDHVKTTLMPDFDYEEFDRRQAEWEASNRDGDHDDFGDDDRQDNVGNEDDDAPKAKRKSADGVDEEMSW